MITELKDRKPPAIHIIDPKSKEVLFEYSIPVNSHISVNEGDKIDEGKLVKIPRTAGKTGDITGGLPRVTELFEARNPSNPAVVSEIEGVASYGNIKRGNEKSLSHQRLEMITSI